MGKRVLLVEGNDDRHVMWAIFQANHVPDSFTVEVAENVEKLLESIPVRLKTSDLESIAFLLDADESIDVRWSQVRDRLLASGCTNLPTTPDAHGTVAQIAGGPRVGVWIMPNNQVPGILEDFLAFLVPKDDVLLPRVDQFLNEIPEAHRRFPPARLPKARMHAWLAIQEAPGKPLGQAITAKYLDARCEHVATFIAWVQRALVDP